MAQYQPQLMKLGDHKQKFFECEMHSIHWENYVWHCLCQFISRNKQKYMVAPYENTVVTSELKKQKPLFCSFLSISSKDIAFIFKFHSYLALHITVKDFHPKKFNKSSYCVVVYSHKVLWSIKIYFYVHSYN